jgi:nitrous oxide reductase accessory protein NosL
MAKYKICNALILSLLVALIMAPIVCAQEDIKEHRDCIHCGMDRKAYGFSRMLIRYDDGTVVGVCSLHCAVIEFNTNPARTVTSIEVADRETRALIDAEKAYWVIGGNKPGVMTMVAKWAFTEKKDAEKFLQQHGGRLATFKEALDTAALEVSKEAKETKTK